MKSFIKRILKPLINPSTLHLYHWAIAVIAQVRYGFPARGIVVVGITGTKGKTTTSHFIAAILQQAGYKVGLTSTVAFQIGEEVRLNEENMSSLPPMQFFKLLREMRSAGCDALVLEATSHALDQERMWGVPFQYVGLTNITHDHLDYHKTWANYQKAKLKLFTKRSVGTAVVNALDPSAELFLASTAAKRRWSYAIESDTPTPRATEHLFAHHVYGNATGTSFIMEHDGNQQKVELQLPGNFSVENALCAAAICRNLNISMASIALGLASVDRVPGRLEKIETRKGFSVMIDYAHTPDSLEKLYATMRADVRGKMVAVLGATGDRDRTKRPIMGALAARFCDYVIVTDEDPYTEDPLHIIEEVAKGVPRGRALFTPGRHHRTTHASPKPIFKEAQSETGEGVWWWKIPDRRAAIVKAIELCKMDDIVLVTGMGAQTYKKVGTEKVAWNERTVIESILQERNLLP